MQSDPYLAANEAARYLAVHPKTIRRLCREGQIAYDRIGRNGRWIRIRRSALDAYARRWGKG